MSEADRSTEYVTLRRRAMADIAAHPAEVARGSQDFLPQDERDAWNMPYPLWYEMTQPAPIALPAAPQEGHYLSWVNGGWQELTQPDPAQLAREAAENAAKAAANAEEHPWDVNPEAFYSDHRLKPGWREDSDGRVVPLIQAEGFQAAAPSRPTGINVAQAPIVPLEPTPLPYPGESWVQGAEFLGNVLVKHETRRDLIDKARAAGDKSAALFETGEFAGRDLAAFDPGGASVGDFSDRFNDASEKVDIARRRETELALENGQPDPNGSHAWYPTIDNLAEGATELGTRALGFTVGLIEQLTEDATPGVKRAVSSGAGSPGSLARRDLDIKAIQDEVRFEKRAISGDKVVRFALAEDSDAPRGLLTSRPAAPKKKGRKQDADTDAAQLGGVPSGFVGSGGGEDANNPDGHEQPSSHPYSDARDYREAIAAYDRDHSKAAAAPSGPPMMGTFAPAPFVAPPPAPPSLPPVVPLPFLAPPDLPTAPSAADVRAPDFSVQGATTMASPPSAFQAALDKAQAATGAAVSYAQEHEGAILGAAGTGVVLGTAATVIPAAVKKYRAKKKAKKSKSSGAAHRKVASHHRTPKKRAAHGGKRKKAHKPRARGGVHNGRRVLIAKNGTRYVKLKSGQVRFIK